MSNAPQFTNFSIQSTIFVCSNVLNRNHIKITEHSISSLKVYIIAFYDKIFINKSLLYL